MALFELKRFDEDTTILRVRWVEENCPGLVFSWDWAGCLQSRPGEISPRETEDFSLPTNQNTPSLMLPDAQEIFLSWDSLQLKNPRWEEISDAVPLTGLASRTGCLLITKIIRTKHFIIVISLDWDVFSVCTGTALVDMLHGTVHATNATWHGICYMARYMLHGTLHSTWHGTCSHVYL